MLEKSNILDDLSTGSITGTQIDASVRKCLVSQHKPSDEGEKHPRRLRVALKRAARLRREPFEASQARRPVERIRRARIAVGHGLQIHTDQRRRHAIMHAGRESISVLLEQPHPSQHVRVRLLPETEHVGGGRQREAQGEQGFGPRVEARGHGHGPAVVRGRRSRERLLVGRRHRRVLQIPPSVQRAQSERRVPHGRFAVGHLQQASAPEARGRRGGVRVHGSRGAEEVEVHVLLGGHGRRDRAGGGRDRSAQRPGYGADDGQGFHSVGELAARDEVARLVEVAITDAPRRSAAEAVRLAFIALDAADPKREDTVRNGPRRLPFAASAHLQVTQPFLDRFDIAEV